MAGGGHLMFQSETLSGTIVIDGLFACDFLGFLFGAPLVLGARIFFISHQVYRLLYLLTRLFVETDE